MKYSFPNYSYFFWLNNLFTSVKSEKPDQHSIKDRVQVVTIIMYIKSILITSFFHAPACLLSAKVLPTLLDSWTVLDTFSLPWAHTSSTGGSYL